MHSETMRIMCIMQTNHFMKKKKRIKYCIISSHETPHCCSGIRRLSLDALCGAAHVSAHKYCLRAWQPAAAAASTLFIHYGFGPIHISHTEPIAFNDFSSIAHLKCASITSSLPTNNGRTQHTDKQRHMAFGSGGFDSFE